MDILILLIIIGWITLVVVESVNAKKKTTGLFPMRWFYFYTYFLLPIWVLNSLVYIDKVKEAEILPLGGIALIVAVFIGLHKRWIWGWYLNWVLLTAWTLQYPLTLPSLQKFSGQEKIFAYAFALVITGFLYLWPNVVYFRKRKVLFRNFR